MVVVQDGHTATNADLSGFDLTPEVIRRVPRALALRYDVLSIYADGSDLTIAMADPQMTDVIDRVRLATGMRVRAVHAPRDVIQMHLNAIYSNAAHEAGRTRRERVEEAPAIRFLDDLQERAILSGASDLHMEPTRAGGRVRQRIDGILHEIAELPSELFLPVVSRIKLLAGMDIADKRQPQDGRYTLETHHRSIDARVSSMPTTEGEKLVIRLLDHESGIRSLEHLGMATGCLAAYKRVVCAPHGFVVVCGPTGSGKTSTLYATLVERNVAAQNLCSVEDPVEIRIAGVAQAQVNGRAGVTFGSALRAFLRQDPDVIMVGEMRDAETASVAISAALSGQLVATTLHSSDAIRAIDRLLELGVGRHHIASALTGVLAQRLVRKLCADCRAPHVTSDSEARALGIPLGQFSYSAGACSRCAGTGYRGRTGIFELLRIEDAVRDAIARGASSVALAALASDAGFAPMLTDGIDKVLAGITSLDELKRVLGFGPSK